MHDLTLSGRLFNFYSLYFCDSRCADCCRENTRRHLTESLTDEGGLQIPDETTSDLRRLLPSYRPAGLCRGRQAADKADKCALLCRPSTTLQDKPNK